MADAPPNYWSYLQQPNFEAQDQQAYQDQTERNFQPAQIAAQQALLKQQVVARNALLAPGGMTPENFAAYTIANPDAAKATQAAHDQMDTDTRNSNLRLTAGVNGYLQAGQPDEALALVNQRKEADKAAGLDTTSHDQLIQLIQTDPKAAQILTGSALAALSGTQPGTNYAAATSALGTAQQAATAAPLVNAKTVADTNLANAQAQAALHPPAKTAAVPGAFNPDGSPVLYNPDAAPPPQAPAGTSPGLASFVAKLLPTESNGDPNAAPGTPGTHALGAGQFEPATWLQILKTNRPDLAQGKSDADILALRSNPTLSAQMTTQYASDNANVLASAGPGGQALPVNGTTLAVMHKLGPADGPAVLNADANAPLNTILSKRVLNANPQLANLTAGQYVQDLAKTFGTDPISTAPNDGTATGDEYLATLPPAKARLIQAIANGDAPAPTGRAAATGAGQQLMQQVLSYDPTASAINLQARLATRKAFTSGAEGQTINSANTLIGHMVNLKSAIQDLGNTNIGLINKPVQSIALAVGNPQTQKAVADFNTYSGLVANEIVKVLRGTNGAEGDIKYWRDQLDSAKSPVALNGVADSMLGAMQSRLEALGAQYSQGMGKVVDPLTLLTPHSQAMLKTLQGSAASGSTPSGQQVAINPQTGQKLVFDTTSNQWKPG